MDQLTREEAQRTWIRRSAISAITLTVVGGAAGAALGGPKHPVRGLLLGAFLTPLALGFPISLLLAPEKALTP